MLFVLLAFSLPLGSEYTFVLIPLPVTTAILAASIIIAIRSRSLIREHSYRRTFQKHRFLRLTLPEAFHAIQSDLRQTILYSVLLVVVLEYVQQPLSGLGIGAFYYQLFATPPEAAMVFAMALPPLVVVAAIAALIVGIFDWFGPPTA
jgi:ABC-type nitrate/sulfonate/bicarbonate transport system permease component